MDKNREIRVRFAPSPTGTLHIGGARTALFNYLFAKRYNGKFILRIEDTDLNRSTEESATVIKNALKWLNMSWDEGPEIGGEYGPYIQTQRKDIYRKYLNKLLEEKKAYKCFCTPEELQEHREKMIKEKKDPIYSRKCLHLSEDEIKKLEEQGKPYTIRFKMPDKTITVDDLVYGKVDFQGKLLTDLIIWKTDDVPTYNFAVVIDDALMKISHVLRAEGHFLNTPSQVAIYEALGFETPQFVHLSTILGPNKKKLSKRDGAVSVEEFKELGYLPEAVNNFIALLGWNPGDDQEIMNLQTLCEKFDIKRVTKAPGIFDINKLNFINSHYLKEIEVDKIFNNAVEYYKKSNLIDENYINNNKEQIKKIVNFVKNHIDKLSDIVETTKPFFIDNFEITEKEALEILKWENSKLVLETLISKLENFENLEYNSIKTIMKEIQKELKEQKVKGKLLFMPIRVALSGSTQGHGVYEFLELVGPKRSILRLKNAIKYC